MFLDVFFSLISRDTSTKVKLKTLYFSYILNSKIPLHQQEPIT